MPNVKKILEAKLSQSHYVKVVFSRFADHAEIKHGNLWGTGFFNCRPKALELTTI